MTKRSQLHNYNTNDLEEIGMYGGDSIAVICHPACYEYLVLRLKLCGVSLVRFNRV